METGQLSHMIKEHDLRVSGAVDPKSVAELGKLLNLQGLVVGRRLKKPGGRSRTVIKLISVKNGSVVWVMEDAACGALKNFPEALPSRR